MANRIVTSTRSGSEVVRICPPYIISPADEPGDRYAAGYEANAFDTYAEAVAARNSLAVTLGGAWVVCVLNEHDRYEIVPEAAR